MYSTGTLTTVVSEVNIYGLTLLAVQETRRLEIKNLKIQKGKFSIVEVTYAIKVTAF